MKKNTKNREITKELMTEKRIEANNKEYYNCNGCDFGGYEEDWPTDLKQTNRICPMCYTSITIY